MAKNLLIKIVFWIITFLLALWMHIHNNDITPATSQNYDILPLTNFTLLTADTNLYFIFFSTEKKYNPLLLPCPVFPT
jgi:hypothetical protein